VESEIVEVTLPNGATALVRARAVDGGGAVKTGRRDKFDFASVAATLEGVTDSIRGALTKAAPDSVSVELSFELAVKSGVLVGLLVDGETTGSITVTLGWERDRNAGG
jgi:Trypsin-co-occurring domain 1